MLLIRAIASLIEEAAFEALKLVRQVKNAPRGFVSYMTQPMPPAGTDFRTYQMDENKSYPPMDESFRVPYRPSEDELKWRALERQRFYSTSDDIDTTDKAK